MTSAKIQQAITRQTQHLLQQALPLCKRHRSTLPDPQLRFDLRGQAAGQAIWQSGQRPILRYNLDIAQRNTSDFLKYTVSHEVAHLLTLACHGRTAPHGPEWQAIMVYLGIKHPKRCHDYTLDESQLRRQRRWSYHCDCSTHQISTTRHRRIESGQRRYLCGRCQGVLQPDQQSMDDQVRQTAGVL